MRVLLFSDLHCHVYKDFAVPPKNPANINSRLENCLTVLDTVRQYAVKHEISTVVFGGDLFDKRDVMRTAMYNLVFAHVSLFAEQGLDLILVVGNHDQTTLDGKVHALEPMKHVCSRGQVYVVDEPATLQVAGGLSIHCVPYMENPTRFREAMVQEANRRGEYNLLVAHGGLQGAVTGPVEYKPKEQLAWDDLPNDSYDFSFFGHYHKRQRIGERCWYIGSPLQQHRGEREDHNKGFLVYDTSTCKFTVKKLKFPEFVTATTATLDTCPTSGNYVDVSANPKDRGQIVVSLADAAAWNLVPEAKAVPKRTSRVAVDQGMSLQEMSKKYIGKYAPKGLDKERLEKLVNSFLEVSDGH